MTIMEHGTQRLGRMISRNVVQADYLAGLIDNHPQLERIAPVGMDIVCFRFKPENMQDEALNRLNCRPYSEYQ